MKKKYIVPCAELILFETNEGIMDDGGVDTSGDIDFGSGSYWDATGTRYTTGNTVVNNNGTPTVIPGGNGGGRQTPLG